MNKNKVALTILSISLPAFMYSMTPNEQLFSAAQIGNIQQVEAVLDAGVNVNTTYTDPDYPIFNDLTALHFACGGTCNNADIVRLLLKRGADASVKDYNGSTPLHDIANVSINNKTAYEIINLLMAAGADINASDNDGQTALHIACTRTDTDANIVVKLLLEAGADITALDNDGQTALHFACDSPHVDTIKLLLERDANVNIRDNDGNTPLHLATRYHYYTLDANQALKKAFKAADLLITAGADINALNNSGHTPLFNAICFHKKAEKFFIKNGTVDNTVTFINIAKLLIESGARSDLKYSDHENQHQCTALDLAKLWNQQEIVKLLSEVPSLKNLSARTIRSVIRQKQATLEQVKSSIPEDLHDIIETNNPELR